MNNDFYNDSLSFNRSLTCLGDFFQKFIESSLFTFSLKDIKTRKICMHNKACSDVWGLSHVGLEGMSSRDCLEHVQNNLDSFQKIDSVLKSFEEEETKAMSGNCTQTNTITMLDYEGFVRIRQHLTMPVSGARNQTVAIAAVCINLTSHANLLHLLGIYQQYYAKPKALEQFSNYLKLKDYFYTPLTFAELSTLLALAEDPRHKQAAQLLSHVRASAISPLTISGHVNAIKDKLKDNVDFYMVLNNFRAYHQWTPEQVVS